MSKNKKKENIAISRKGKKAAFKYVKRQLKNPIIDASAQACYDAAPNEFKEFIRYLFGDKKGSELINYVGYMTGGDDNSECDDEDEENDDESDFASEYPPPVLYTDLGRYLENGDIESLTITAQLTSPYCEVDDAFTISKAEMACIDRIDAFLEVLYNKVALSIATTAAYAYADVSNSNLFGHIKSEYARMYDKAKSREIYAYDHIPPMIMTILDCICGNKDTTSYTHCISLLRSISSSVSLYGIKSIEVSYYDINDKLVEFKKEFELKSKLLPSEVIPMMYETMDHTAISTGNNDVSRLSVGEIVVFGTDGEYNVPGNIVRVGRITKIRKQIIEISVPYKSEFADPISLDPLVETTRKSLAESIISVLNPRTAVITPKAALYFKNPNIFGSLLMQGDKDTNGRAWCNTIQKFINGGYKDESRYAIMNDILEYINSKTHADISEGCVIEADVPAKLVDGHMSVNIIDIQKTDLNPIEDVPSDGIMIGGMKVYYGDIVVYGSDAANYGAGEFVRVGRLTKSDKPDTVCITSPVFPEGIRFNTEYFKKEMFVKAYLGSTIVLTQYQAFVGDGKDEVISSDSTFRDLIKREIGSAPLESDDIINEVGNRYNIDTDDKNIYIVDESAAKRCDVMHDDGTTSSIINAICITIHNAGE